MNTKIKVLFSLMIFGLCSQSVFSFEPAEKFKSTCLSCHTIGGGDKIGPDLKGVSKRRSMDWIVKFVQYPEGMIKGDPEEPGYEKKDKVAEELFNKYKTIMTEQDLSEDQIKQMITWIEAQKEVIK